MTYKAAVDIAILQIYNLLSFMKDVWDFLTRPSTKRALEYEKLAMAKYNHAFIERRVDARLAIEHPRHLEIC